jgi:hypothetical protein
MAGPGPVITTIAGVATAGRDRRSHEVNAGDDGKGCDGLIPVMVKRI